MATPRCLGMFDSGLGGLTVLKEILKTNTYDKIVYFGDTGRVPYGNRTPETIIAYARQDVRFLMSHGAQEIIIACGTASANALAALKQEFTLPITGVIEASAKGAIEKTHNRRIGIIGTKATINSGVYQQRLKELDPQVEITALACPLFVPLVEYGLSQDAKATSIVVSTVSYYLQEMKDNKIDTLIMGCTHYPLLQPEIAGFMGPEVTLINSGVELASRQKATERITDPQLEFYVSDNETGFGESGRIFLDLTKPMTAQKIDITQY